MVQQVRKGEALDGRGALFVLPWFKRAAGGRCREKAESGSKEKREGEMVRVCCRGFLKERGKREGGSRSRRMGNKVRWRWNLNLRAPPCQGWIGPGGGFDAVALSAQFYLLWLKANFVGIDQWDGGGASTSTDGQAFYFRTED